jgi:hypothetical protein
VTRRELPGHEVRTVQELGWAGTGWAGTRNGALLRRAAAEGFAALVTVDRNLEYQQHLPGVGVGVVALLARSNDVADLPPLVPEVCAVLPSLAPGQVARVPRQPPPDEASRSTGRRGPTRAAADMIRSDVYLVQVVPPGPAHADARDRP